MQEMITLNCFTTQDTGISYPKQFGIAGKCDQNRGSYTGRNIGLHEYNLANYVLLFHHYIPTPQFKEILQ